MGGQGFSVFVISLARARERRVHMERALGRIGLEAEFVDAVDGRRLGAADRAQYDSRKARVDYRSEMTDAEIACYLSHYRLYQRICAEGLPMALILEDDIEIAPELTGVLASLAAQADPEWTVVRLQSQRGRVICPKPRERGRLVCTLAGGDLYRLDTHVLGGCAYLIRREAAERMLAYGRRISRPIDQTLDRYWENGIAPYVVRPLPVRQHPDFGSEIGARGRAAFAEERTLDAVYGRLRRSADGIQKRLFRAADRVRALHRSIEGAMPTQGLRTPSDATS